MVSVKDSSILKKTIAVFMLMITAFVFFSINVYATTYNPTTYNTFSDSITISDVTYSLRVTQFKALSTGTSMLPSGMETIMFVVFQLTNDNDQDALCQVPQFSIDLSDQRVITDVYTYAGDLALGITSNGFIILPTEPYSYDASNKIVVPANSTLTLVGGIGLPAQLNQTGDGTLDTGLRNVHLLYKPYTVTLGSYVHGTPIDISPVVDVLDTIIDNQETAQMSIDDIIDLISYTGTNFQYASSAIDSNSKSYDLMIDEVKRGVVQVYRVVGSPYLISVDTNYNPTSDTQITNGAIRYPVMMKISIQILNNLYMRNESIINNCLPTYTGLHVEYMYSDNFKGINVQVRDLYLYHRHFIGNSSYYTPGWYNTYIIGYIDVPLNRDVTFQDYSLGNFFRNTGLGKLDYNPPDEYTILRDLYIAYSQVNGLDDSSDISNDVADVSDSNHIIEESYYSANASAIEATGLSNYRFSNEQNNGIGKVADDFMLLWNALGSWNGVYIFSLTMALATFIMRHGGLFTVKRQTSDKGGESE